MKSFKISAIVFYLSALLPALVPVFATQQKNMPVSADDSIAYLNLPDRRDDAAEGSVFAALISDLNIDDRERAVVDEILSGNVPSFSRKLKPLKISESIDGKNYEVVFFTLCDYLAIGSDRDYLYIPLRPSTAQYLADRLNASMPTKKLVDVIYSNADIKLHPQPIPPSEKMTTVPVFLQHTDSIKQQIEQIGFDRSADLVIGGHKKDVIISNKIYSSDRDFERVVIYGWHLSENNPIQPVYNGHSADYADYSHGIRFIFKTVYLNGDSTGIADILGDAILARLLSDEGVISKPYYPESDLFTSIENPSGPSFSGLRLYQNYPNPFNPATAIRYQLAYAGPVDLSIFNMLGQKVATLVSAEQQARAYTVRWNGTDDWNRPVSSGIYLCKLTAANQTYTRKMILLR